MKTKAIIKEYQCSGCANGSDTNCFLAHHTGVGCGKHSAGTMIPRIGKIFLGMPKGFDRLGFDNSLIPTIFEKFENNHYNMWNIPVWKFKNENGHTLVRGLMPRLNQTFLHIYLEDCLDKIDCLEISQEDVNGMD